MRNSINGCELFSQGDLIYAKSLPVILMLLHVHRQHLTEVACLLQNDDAPVSKVEAADCVADHLAGRNESTTSIEV